MVDSTTPDADPLRRRTAAYDAYVRRLSNAWRTPGRDAAPDDPDDDPDDDPRTEPDTDDRRERAYNAYKDQLSWRGHTGAIYRACG
jgi:hypothetical protein